MYQNRAETDMIIIYNCYVIKNIFFITNGNLLQVENEHEKRTYFDAPKVKHHIIEINIFNDAYAQPDKYDSIWQYFTLIFIGAGTLKGI